MIPRRHKLTAYLVPGKTVFVQQQYMGSALGSGDRARGTRRPRTHHDQIVFGCFHAITPMRSKKYVSVFNARRRPLAEASCSFRSRV